MNIRNLISITFFAITILSVVGSVFFFYSVTDNVLQDIVSNQVTSIAQTKTDYLQTSLENKIERSKLISGNTRLQKSLDGYNKRSIPTDQSTIQEIIDNAQTYMRDVEELSIIDPLGNIVVSSIPEKSLDSYANQEFFQKKDELQVYLVPGDNEKVILQISDPLFLNDEFIGLLLTKSRADTIVTTVHGYTGLGEKGDIFILDNDGLLLVPSRFIDVDSLQKDIILPEVFTSCQNESDVVPVVSYSNYKDVPVQGTVKAIDGTSWCLLVEVDEEEAFGNYTIDLLKVLIGAMMFVIFIVSIVGLIIARLISKPINDITKNIETISKGDLDVELGESRIDELKTLTYSLDRILSSMKLAVYRGHLTKKEIKHKKKK